MRKIVFLGGMAVGLAISWVAPVWADKGDRRVEALEARIAALEAKVGADPRNKRIELAASEFLNADIGKRITIKAADQISFETGRASLVMWKDGRITIDGGDILIKGDVLMRDAGNRQLNGNKIGQN